MLMRLSLRALLGFRRRFGHAGHATVPATVAGKGGAGRSVSLGRVRSEDATDLFPRAPPVFTHVAYISATEMTCSDPATLPV